MKFDFQDKATLITGASSGIGAELAREIVRRGGKVALIARREDAMQKLAAEIDPGGEKTSIHMCDVTDLQTVKTTVADVIEKWRRIDVAVLNAGVGSPTNFRDFRADHVRRIYETNIFGVANFLECILPHMQESGGGVIAGVSSLAAHFPSAWVTAYASSKAALMHFLDGMRKKLKKQNIKVIDIEPGFVRTPMTAENKRMPLLVEVEDAARIIADGIERGKPVIRFPKPLAALALLNRALPARLRYIS